MLTSPHLTFHQFHFGFKLLFPVSEFHSGLLILIADVKFVSCGLDIFGIVLTTLERLTGALGTWRNLLPLLWRMSLSMLRPRHVLSGQNKVSLVLNNWCYILIIIHLCSLFTHLLKMVRFCCRICLVLGFGSRVSELVQTDFFEIGHSVKVFYVLPRSLFVS